MIYLKWMCLKDGHIDNMMLYKEMGIYMTSMITLMTGVTLHQMVLILMLLDYLVMKTYPVFSRGI